MQVRIEVASPAPRSARAQQVRGMFDLQADAGCRAEWDLRVPLDERKWNLGLIVGPSGCGKSTIARHLFPEMSELDAGGRPREFAEWVGRGCVVDAFPEGMPIKDVVAMLSAVGFSSPPAWLRPFAVLSTGQRFRVTLALLLAWSKTQRVIFDEYTSVVDRTVAQVGSAAVAKLIRASGRQFVAVTCHEDVEEWLQPDWVLRPAESLFAWRCLRRRPPIDLDIVRVQASAWKLFAPHHYLSHALHAAAVCFLASRQGRPAAFSAWLPLVASGPRSRREHRTVTLPDFQGVGIGNALSDFVASLWCGLGYRALSTTTHPAMIRSRLQSPSWRLVRAPSLGKAGDRRMRHATTRLTAGFAYCGPALAPMMARALLEKRP